MPTQMKQNEVLLPVQLSDKAREWILHQLNPTKRNTAADDAFERVMGTFDEEARNDQD